MDTNAPIGVFDSGVGGLTVAREIMRQIPNERIVYFGDTARVPYGSKSKDIITKYSRQIIRFLLTENVKAIVIACNTASAFALDTMQKEFDIPIIGVLKPGAKVAAKTTVNGRIGLIGTEGTIHSGMYAQFIKSIKPDVEVIGKPCPLFVPLVEEGMLHDTITDQVAERYLSTLKDKNIDTLIMGCTHYPLLRSTIRRVMGESVNLVNPAYETAIELKKLLENKNLANVCDVDSPSSMYRFYVSDAAEKFKAFANSILPFDITMTKQINIEQY
jgi:glutamate racemase